MQKRSIKMTCINQPAKLVWQISARRRAGKTPEPAPVAETRLNVVLRGIALVPDLARLLKKVANSRSICRGTAWFSQRGD